MYWIIVMILATTTAFINPYIGLFAIFSLAPIVIYFCIDTNIKARVKLAKYNERIGNAEYAERLTTMARTLSNIWLGVSIGLCLLISVVYTFVWSLASGKGGLAPTVVTPFVIFRGDFGVISGALFAITIILNMATVVLVFNRKRKLLDLAVLDSDEEETTIDVDAEQNRLENIKFKVSWLTWILWLGVIAISLLDNSVGVIAIPLSMFYLLIMFIVNVTIKSHQKVLRGEATMVNLVQQFVNVSDDYVKGNSMFMLNNMSRGGMSNILLSVAVWFLCIVMIGVSTLLNFVPVSNNIFVVIDINLGYLPFIVSCILHIALAVSFTRDIRKI